MTLTYPVNKLTNGDEISFPPQVVEVIISQVVVQQK